MKFKTGATEYPFYIDVRECGIDLQETTAGLVLDLRRRRSNSESDPGAWDYGYIHKRFQVSTGTATAGRATPWNLQEARRLKSGTSLSPRIQPLLGYL
ncbi:hypothetical protein NXW13_00665, partial [Bacteroides thetaiotaomicron]|nr:hypothetical protein [Bacteroides thetaiotaomicron]